MVQLSRIRRARLRGLNLGGVMLGALLGLGLLIVVRKDWQGRVDAAQRQSLALASSTERLMRLELRTLERALQGVADDGHAVVAAVPGQAAVLLQKAVTGLTGRHQELDSVVVVDPRGNPITAGRGDPSLPQWTHARNRSEHGLLYVGPLERVGPDRWVMRLSLQMDPDRWLLARLHTDELREILANLDVGRNGVVVVSDAEGRLLVHSLRSDTLTGRQMAPAAPDLLPGQVLPLGTDLSAVDGVRRVAATAVSADYPLRIYAGVDHAQMLRPWWPFLAGSALVYLLYWAGFFYLRRNVRRAEYRQARLEAELRVGDDELRLAHQVGGIGTWSIDGHRQRLRWTARTRQMFRLRGMAMPVAAVLRLVHPGDRARVKAAMRDARDGRDAFDLTCRLVLGGEDERWIAARGARVQEEGRPQRMTGTVVDISERVEIQTLALDAQRQFRLIFEMNPLPCWLFDRGTLRFLEVNPAAVRQYGYSREEFLRMRVTDIRPPAYLDDLDRALRQLETSPHGNLSLITVHRHRDGHLIDVQVHTARLEIAGIQALMVLAENVSEHMAYQRELAYRASHEPLTGLLTVPALCESLNSEQSGTRYTIAHVQLRGLQLISDTLGREIGKEVLRNLCRRLYALAERYGGLACQPAEDFVLVIDPQHDVDAVIAALGAALAEPVQGFDSFHQLDLRIGVAEYPGDGSSAEDVIAKAAQAAHAAREEGVGVVRFDESLAARMSERLRLAGRLHQAIGRGEFELHYQSIHRRRDGRPVALEALIRWPQTQGPALPPDAFIQLSEDTGLILPLGRWAIRQAARDQRRLADSGFGDLSIAVNVSALQFLNSDLAAEVAAATAEFGLRQGALHVELTESSLMRRPTQALEAMHRLHAQGVSISLDDFGTGFSNMSYLQHMPLDSLKIDRGFIADVDTSAHNASICRALLTLGHSLGLTVIAEGVETRAQYDWLAVHGCDQMQGYLLGRPQPMHEMIEQLRRESR